MAERKGENQPTPLQLAVEATSNFAKEEAEKDGAFQQAVAQMKQKIGGEKAEENAKGLVKSGMSMAMARIGLLPAFANPDPAARKELVEKIKKDNPEAEGLEIYQGWDVNSDPNGVGLINHFQNADLGKIREKAKTEEEKKSAEIQIEGLQKGWEIIKKVYKSKLESSNTPAQRQQLARAA